MPALLVGSFYAACPFVPASTQTQPESVSAMLGKLSTSQRQIADRAREFDIVIYGPGGPISSETPVVGPIAQTIAQTCVVNALQELRDGHTTSPAQLAINAADCQVQALKRNEVAKKLGVRVLAFGPSS